MNNGRELNVSIASRAGSSQSHADCVYFILHILQTTYFIYFFQTVSVSANGSANATENVNVNGINPTHSPERQSFTTDTLTPMDPTQVVVLHLCSI